MTRTAWLQRRWQGIVGPALIGLLMALAVSVLLAGCGGESPITPRVIGVITAQQLWADLFSASPPRVIDVRDAADYELATVPHSSNHPCGCPALSDSAAAAGDEIVLVGKTEHHARSGASSALAPGEQAWVLAGGITAWPYGLDINDAKLNEWLGEGRTLRLIDVRTPAEWQECRIAGTENQPLADIDAWAPTIDPSQEVVLICGMGGRSSQARDDLARRGLTRIHNLVGGVQAWRYGLVGDACSGTQ